MEGSDDKPIKTYIFAMYDDDVEVRDQLVIHEHKDHLELWPGSWEHPEIWPLKADLSPKDRLSVIAKMLLLFLQYPSLR